MFTVIYSTPRELAGLLLFDGLRFSWILKENYGKSPGVY